MNRNECRFVLWEREWSVEDIECGDCSTRPDDWEFTYTVNELANRIRGYQPSQSHLHACMDLSRVWFSRTSENYRTGGSTEESIHLHHEASPREARIWGWAIRYALKRGWIA